jgi:hypothetical protein
MKVQTMHVISTTKNKSCGSYIPAAAANSIPASHPGAKFKLSTAKKGGNWHAPSHWSQS